MSTVVGVRSTVPTWEMTTVELARVWADHFGYGVRPRSNWIYTPAGRPVRPGWVAFADLLVQLGYIVPERGVDWMAAHRLPHARTIAAHCSPSSDATRRTRAGHRVRVGRSR